MSTELWARTTPIVAFFACLLGSALAAQQPAPQAKPSEAAPVTPQPQPSSAATNLHATDAKPAPAKIVVPAGTRLPLVLHNAVSTRAAKPGDSVYFETLFPIVQDNHIIIPAGSYVSGEVTEAKRPGRVKGRGEIAIRLNTLILPNGYTVSFNAVPTSSGTGGAETTDAEGKIKGDTAKAADVGTVIRTTSIGAGIGAVATRTPKGAGIGAGIGAATGLGAVLLSRGPEVVLPRGTTIDVLLDRPLYLDADKAQFTTPGQASTLPGPPNREPRRRSFPF